MSAKTVLACVLLARCASSSQLRSFPTPRADAHCLGLSKDGFPLPVEEIFGKVGHNKSQYFAHIVSAGYDGTLKIVGPGKLYDPSTLFQEGGKRSHVIFVGDCMQLMNMCAFMRAAGLNVRRGETECVQRMTSLLEVGERALLSNISEQDARKTSTFAGKPVELVVAATWQRISIPGDEQMPHLSYITWYGQSSGGMPFKAIRETRKDLRQLKAGPIEGGGLVLWMGVSIWSCMGVGESDWTIEKKRSLKLTSFVTKLRSAFPGVQLVWDAPSWIDLPILTAEPPKKESVLEKYLSCGANGVNSLMRALSATDKAVARKLRFAATQRFQVTSMYRGLQCDGVHTEPTKVPRWHCPGYGAIEDLVLQSGLYSLGALRGLVPEDVDPLCPHLHRMAAS